MIADNKPFLPIVEANKLERYRYNPIDIDTIQIVDKIIKDISNRGETALREYATYYGDIMPGAPLLIDKKDFKSYVSKVDIEKIELIERTAIRIRDFARQQLQTISELNASIEGGKAGHRLLPITTAGCYSPGGRYPLLSTVLMTVIPARIAGVENVIVATPKPSPDMIAAAYIAEADCILTIGGAQAIAGMVYGTGDIPRCDLIVGPGNRWVSAAKQLLYGQVAIDMIAGPSELVVFADDSANSKMIAIDLLAQAEHDTDALPVLISLSSKLVDDVRSDLKRLLDEYPTETAERSLANGFAVKVNNIDEGVDLCNQIAPEHLELNLKDVANVIPKLKHYGALFIGQQTAEVFGDYGAGPNHVLPTSGTARFASGLSVMTFLRQATWLELDSSDDDSAVARDAADFARLEGLYWHSRAAQVRMNRSDQKE